MRTTPDQPASSGQHGLVISYFGNSVAVEADNGQVFQCHLRRNQELPIVGDKVIWQLEKDQTGLIVSIEPRRTLLTRGEGHGKKKGIAANVDIMFIVMAPPPVFSTHLVDRYLIAAELLGIQPIVVMNKIDLINDENRSASEDCLAPYRTVPYEIVLSSVINKNGLDELLQLISQKTAVLVGPSGVGKSSTISALGDQEIRTANVSPKGTGKHTTTATRLYHLPNGGTLIDSPGVREFNLWPVPREDILRGFREFQPFLSGCKFRNCQHVIEPGCALLAAAAEGKIHPYRFSSYLLMLRETPVADPYAKKPHSSSKHK